MKTLTKKAVSRRLAEALERPERRVSVITIIVGLGLTAVWTGADEYRAASDRRAALDQQLREAQRAEAQLPAIRRRAADVENTLEELRERLVTIEDGHAFREYVIAMARRAGCEVRRIHLAQPQRRPWHPGDDPLAMGATTAAQKPSPFTLERRTLSLTISGSLAAIESLLEQFEATGKVIHTRRLGLKPDRSQRNVTTMEMELVLFGLSRKEITPTG